MIPVDDVGFAALTRLVSARSGLALDAYKDKCLKRRIAVRMRARGVHSYAEYQDVLERDPAEYERLKDAITINVTRFYRNPETWDRLRRDVLPALLRARDGHLRAWSAGCASGEEAYTLAMVVADLAAAAGQPDWLGRLSIDATDIDRGSLERAGAGWYRNAAFNDMPRELVERYTRPVSDGREVSERVRRCLHVHRHDLSVPHAPAPPYDLICCRNVLIYFERPMQERLFSLFADVLRPGGYLVLGKVETLMGPARDRLALVDVRERVYRRAA